ncbi:putative zinc finger CCHC domain-containing protein 3-like [Apostichopus japonicus]|uniref:Putative zinc finger CCHC domain-containing protein 3-like n=1 Tax=Stichopus japonicus TaxID=307972 RepID=A0A2G8JP44_STIJA|nr:putative zinc finger CCHC domain-containing protein 3-like [Apostichopus japonicus]
MSADLIRSQSVLMNFDEDNTMKGIGISAKKHLVTVQSLLKREFDVTFKTDDLKRQFMPVLCGLNGVTSTSYTYQVKIVTVLYVPFELDDNVVRFILGKYGKVCGSRFQEYREFHGLFNGTRQYKVELEKDIPSSLKLGGRNCWIRYSGQPRTCLKCDKEGHIASECQEVRCFNCLKLGHTSKNCEAPVSCQTCGKSGHMYRDSPISFANKVRPQSSEWAECDNHVTKELGGPKPLQDQCQPVTYAVRTEIMEDAQVESEAEDVVGEHDTPATTTAECSVETPVTEVEAMEVPVPNSKESKRKADQTDDKDDAWITPKRSARSRRESPIGRGQRSQSRDGSSALQRAKERVEQCNIWSGKANWISCVQPRFQEAFHSFEDIVVHLEE